MNRETAKLSPEDMALSATKKISNLKSLKVIYSFLLPYKGMLLAAFLALVVAAGAQLAIFYSFKDIVDNGLAARDSSAISREFLMLLGIGFVWATGIFFRFRYVTMLGERVVADIRMKVHSNLVGMSPVFFEVNRPGEISSRLTADTTLIQTIVGSSASVALRSIVTMFGGFILLFILNPKLTALMLLVIPVLAFAFLYFGKRVRLRTRSGQDKLAEVGAMAGEAFSLIQVVQAFTQEDEERKRFSTAVEETYDVAKKRIAARAWMMGLVTILFFSAVVLVLWTGAIDVIGGKMTWGELTAFVGLAIMVVASVGALSSVYGDIQKMIGATGRLNELMSVSSPLKVVKNPVAPKQPVAGNVTLSRVTFSYPSKPDVKALENFSLQAKAGEIIALVGPSGAGKTTLFQILLRFFDPQKGVVKIDGIDTSKMDPKALRTLITIVPQETILFAQTILENVRYGRPEATRDEVLAALKDAQAMDFVNALPKGLNTYIGERGVRLSGGQRQRISIARAILRGSPIFLLDEATSSLDSASEQKVQKALEELMKHHTTFVIAHRLSTVRGADTIIVMDEGKVVARGKHTELMKQKGLYARLAELQFRSDPH